MCKCECPDNKWDELIPLASGVSITVLEAKRKALADQIRRNGESTVYLAGLTDKERGSLRAELIQKGYSIKVENPGNERFINWNVFIAR